MNIRTVTVGLPLARLRELQELEPRLARFFDLFRAELAANDIAVRTCRIALSPVREDPLHRVNQAEVTGLVNLLSQTTDRLGVRWFNVPFDLTRATHSTTLDDLADLAFEVLRRFPRSFVNLLVADGGRIHHAAARRASRFVKAVSLLETSGYHNFRVGIGCNVRPDTPFFPFSFSSDQVGFSLGLELPQQLLQVVGSLAGAPLAEIRETILDTQLPQIRQIQAIAERAVEEHGLVFHGIDLSIAPYPEAGGSVAQLIELLGVEQFGAHGTLFLIGFLTDVLRELARRGPIRTAGFGGVMLSLLEDEVMGRRNNTATFSLDSLIMYSTMCGCGVDMVPLPGDTFEEEIASMILDVAAVSTLLDKPLGVRVLPIPMKQENELTCFQMDFLYNTRVKKIRNVAFAGAGLAGEPFAFLGKR